MSLCPAFRDLANGPMPTFEDECVRACLPKSGPWTWCAARSGHGNREVAARPVVIIFVVAVSVAAVVG